MKNSIWRKRIPTLLGLLIITAAIGITTLLAGQNTFFVQQASPTTAPQDVRITNISDSSFTVSYTTASPILGSLNFGPDQKLGKTISDEKDNGKIIQHSIHSFTVNNLSPSTKYYFSIVSGQDSYLNNNAPYEITTGNSISEKPGSGFIIGKILTLDNTPPKEAIVYMTSQGAQALSTSAKSDGSYTLSLENLRSQNLISFFQFKPGATIKMLIVSDKGTSSVNLSAQDINNVPTIVISKNYDFTQLANSTPASSSAQSQFPSISNNNSQSKPTINSPSKDQILTIQTPTFRGTAIPNEKISITIQSTQEIQGQVTVDANGNWSFTPSTPLSPGQHTITIVAKDASGVLRTISQTFTIQAALAASPTPTPTPTPTPSLFPTPSVSASALPTPTATPIVIATPTPIAIATPVPTPLPTLAPTGTSEVSTGIMGIVLTFIGVGFFFLSRVLL